MDRTQEFLGYVNRSTAVNSRAAIFKRDPDLSSFQQDVRELGEELHASRLRLQRLKKLVRSGGIFEDNTSEVSRLVDEIKAGLTTASNRLDAVEGNVRGQSQDEVHHRTQIGTLRNRLLDQTRELKAALDLRTKSIQDRDSRRKKYDFGRKTDSPFMDLETGAPQQQALENPASAYHQARVEGVEHIQRVLAELGQIFSRVATMVAQQEEMVTRIDADADLTMSNLRAGENELVRYLKRLSSNRSLIMKIFGILMTFGVFFIMFVA
ncbi:MAG: uncharacterized protein KVP18_001834 [Porospora cf. gigantea A]|uniref:uncharacterized protein n=1 Tax=Porospora cf. gigantea A TaxID=2853593 RepID=UPI0035599F1A|nr:MAG: hypothetical protein KVP18_001834 [Porospora cf. gigantea A]